MESPREKSLLTPSQRQAVAARGNVLVMAGAGTGKTHTLVERCLDCLGNERASLDEILVVTFTEAAAAEMRQRLRRALEEKSRHNPDDPHLAEQLALFDAAHIGTLHGFCLKLVREHFYELGLDPQPAVLDEGEARLLANETLEEELQAHYAGEDELGRGGPKPDSNLRRRARRKNPLAGFAPAPLRANPARCRRLARAANRKIFRRRTGRMANVAARRHSTTGAMNGCRFWKILTKPPANREKAAELAGILRAFAGEYFSREAAAEVLEQIISADGNWPAKRKTVLRKPLEDLFDEAIFLASLAPVKNGNDPLAEDWNWVRGHMTALLRLTQNFAARFAARKRDDGVLDFHDLEQFALKLLWDFSGGQTDAGRGTLARKTPVRVRGRISGHQRRAGQNHPGVEPRRRGSANRFLVGDVKQSIYRFRLADPKIFRDYAENWRGKNGQTIPLAENFRSREALLDFREFRFRAAHARGNRRRGLRCRGAIAIRLAGNARGARASPKDPSPRAELLLRLK